jgi:hypothetical protein
VDLGVEHLQEGTEVAVARSGEERIDDAALLREVTVRLRRAAHAPAGAARQLLGGRLGAVEDRRDLGEGHAEDVVQHERESLGGAERVQDHQHGQADGVGQHRFVLGIDGVRQRHHRVMSGELRRASRRVRRDRSMFRQTRPTTVVSQACMLSTAIGSWSRIRSHASWRASSVSLTEPSIW